MIYNANESIKKYRKTKKNSIFHLSMLDKIEDFLIKNGLPRDNFLKNRKTVTIVKDSNQSYSTYNPSFNSIVYTDNDELLHELFHMSSSNGNNKSTGITKFIGDTKINIGLDEGITDIFASLIDKNSTCNNILEKICAQIFLDAFGFKIFNGYFNNSYHEFINNFDAKIRDSVEYIMDLLDKYYYLKNKIFKIESFKKVPELHTLTYDIIANLFDLYEDLNLDRKDLAELINNAFSKISDDYKITLGFDKIDLDELSKELCI